MFSVLQTLFVAMICFLNYCLVAAGVVYLKELQGTLDSTNEENVKLLDAMHEGILIIKKVDKEVIFCNQPAEKLLTKFIGDSKEKVMHHMGFLPVKI